MSIVGPHTAAAVIDDDDDDNNDRRRSGGASCPPPPVRPVPPDIPPDTILPDAARCCRCCRPRSTAAARGRSGHGCTHGGGGRSALLYEIKPSFEMSLLPYVEKYRGSTYFFCLTTHDWGRFGWIMVAGGDRLIPDPPAPV